MLRTLAAIIALTAGTARAGPKTTTVTTYVTTVQEERETTRWTLTEWLRIKERMKMMDVWLAMFSDPKKDRFAPELMLSYGMTRGSLAHASGGAEQTAALSGKAGKAQLWLTNLVSSTVGIRMLNVDLGVEGFQRQTGSFQPEAATGTTPVDETPGDMRTLKTSYYSGNLRVFGKNVQDSSLVLKYGRYSTANAIAGIQTTSGAAAGAELQLYLFRWLGLEGNYMRYDKAAGSYYDYQAYIEISLLRFSGGPYMEEWTKTSDETGLEVKTKEKGYVGNVKLSF